VFRVEGATPANSAIELGRHCDAGLETAQRAIALIGSTHYSCACLRPDVCIEISSDVAAGRCEEKAMQSFSAAATDNRDFVTDATSLAQRAVEKFGRVDRLVNNAGIVTMGWIERRADAQIDRMRAGGARHQPTQDGNGEYASRPKGMSPVVVSAPNASLRQHRPVGRRGGESTS